VLRFLAGFLAASALWGGFLYAYTQGLLNIDLEPRSAEDADAGVEELPLESEETTKKGKRKRRGKRNKNGTTRRYSGESLSGDDLGGPDDRHMDPTAAGGEEQLRGSEIEQGFDSVFPKVRRCLLLLADDEPVTGKLIFGMRISGAGRVERVNLKGPSAITKTEAGDCMRKAARSIQFRSFNGPDMLVHFPMTLE